jgi:hypothetical protein
MDNQDQLSSCSHDSQFTVKPGPSHLNSPLGMTASHDHYIQPVPPMYVTTYEDSYVWPPTEAYHQDLLQHKDSGVEEHKHGNKKIIFIFYEKNLFY